MESKEGTKCSPQLDSIVAYLLKSGLPADTNRNIYNMLHLACCVQHCTKRAAAWQATCSTAYEHEWVPWAICIHMYSAAVELIRLCRIRACAHYHFRVRLGLFCNVHMSAGSQLSEQLAMCPPITMLLFMKLHHNICVLAKACARTYSTMLGKRRAQSCIHIHIYPHAYRTSDCQSNVSPGVFRTHRQWWQGMLSHVAGENGKVTMPDVDVQKIPWHTRHCHCFTTARLRHQSLPQCGICYLAPLACPSGCLK